MGRPRLRRSEILERRDQIYRLFLSGMSETAIAGKLGISQQAVSEHIVKALKAKTPKSRRQAYYALGQEIADSARLAKSRAYKVLDEAIANKNGSLVLGALSRIQASDAILLHLKGDLSELAGWEAVDELEAAVAEQRLAQKVLPSGRHVPFE
jgi:biotin operon repressor